MGNGFGFEAAATLRANGRLVHKIPTKHSARRRRRKRRLVPAEVRHQQNFWIGQVVRVLFDYIAAGDHPLDVLVRNLSKAHAAHGMRGDEIAVSQHRSPQGYEVYGRHRPRAGLLQLIQQGNIFHRLGRWNRFEIRVDVGQLRVRRYLFGKRGHGAGGAADVADQALRVQTGLSGTRRASKPPSLFAASLISSATAAPAMALMVMKTTSGSRRLPASRSRHIIG